MLLYCLYIAFYSCFFVVLRFCLFAPFELLTNNECSSMNAVNSSQWTRHGWKKKHDGELVTDAKKMTVNSSQKIPCDEFTVWRVHWLPSLGPTCYFGCCVMCVLLSPSGDCFWFPFPCSSTGSRARHAASIVHGFPCARLGLLVKRQDVSRNSNWWQNGRSEELPARYFENPLRFITSLLQTNFNTVT